MPNGDEAMRPASATITTSPSASTPRDESAATYAAYAESYRARNGDDGRLAKNLARWLEGDDGLPVWSDDPMPPDALGCDGEPLDMEGLAKVDPGFAKLWRRVAARRSVILSLLYDRKPGTSREVEAECETDEALARHMEACEERYGRYLALCDSMEGGIAAGRRAALIIRRSP